MPNTPPQPSILQAIKEGLDSVPLVTRYLVFGTLALSISSNLGIISAKQLILYPPLILEKYELWRLFTAHLLSTGSSMIWHVVFMYQYSKDLEENAYSNRKADYLFLIILSMLLLDVIGGFYGFMLLSGPFGMAIVTLFANSSPDKVVNFMFGFQFKAQFLPWILLAFVSRIS